MASLAAAIWIGLAVTGDPNAGQKAESIQSAARSPAKAEVRLIAHRGGVVDGQLIENSLPALEEAIRRGYWMVEVDVRRTADGVPLAHHDKTFSRYFGDPRQVEDLKLDEIRSLRSNPGNQPPRTLAELLAATEGRIGIMLDVKVAADDPEFFGQIEELLDRFGMRDRAILIGTDAAHRHFLGKIPTSISSHQLQKRRLAEADDDEWKRFAEHHFLFGRATDFRPELVAFAAERGILAIPAINTFHYTGRDPRKAAQADCDRLRQMGLSTFQIDSVYEPFFREVNLDQVPVSLAKPNATLADEVFMTIGNIGAGQSMAQRGGRIYILGDWHGGAPRAGVIREYNTDLRPTRQAIRLERNHQPYLLHPTGMTWINADEILVGDTADRKATLHVIALEVALADGHLDAGLRKSIIDDAARNGCRPEKVTLGDRDFIATADYGDQDPELRLYDLKALLRAGRTSEPGVVAHRLPNTPFTQSLSWNPKTGELTQVQNVTEGKGWRLETIHLETAIADGSALSPRALRSRLVFPNLGELKGYLPLGNEALFLTASPFRNLIRARMVRDP